jgi:hypothetical protein
MTAAGHIEIRVDSVCQVEDRLNSAVRICKR